MDKVSLAFDLSHPLIEVHPPASEEAIRVAERSLGVTLPPSYKWWLTQYADGADINAGNALWLHECDTVVSQTKWWRDWDLNSLKDIVVFGMSGVDSQTYAFFTGCKSPEGEYPIVWITPGSVRSEGFAILNSGFDRFLNIHVQNLLAHESSDLMKGNPNSCG